MDYQEVLNSQEIFADELAMFAKKELQKEVSYSKINRLQSEISFRKSYGAKVSIGQSECSGKKRVKAEFIMTFK
jgi:hypothetical protein